MKRPNAWVSLCVISLAASAAAQDKRPPIALPKPGVSLVPKLNAVGEAARESGNVQADAPRTAAPAATPRSAAPSAKAPSAPPKVQTAAAQQSAAKEADTDGLPQFDKAVEYKPRGPNTKVSFSLEDADLGELVRVIGQLTGKRFIFGPKVKSIKASVYSPQKITVAEAYQAFLTILDQNGLTVVPHGRFLKIIDTEASASQGTPMIGPNGTVPSDERYVTHLKRMSNMGAEEAATLLAKFKSKTADVTAYAPGNLLIITDTGANIRRMLGILDQIDVGSAGDQVWIEPMHYAAASDVASRIGELFDVKAGGSANGKKGAAGGSDGGTGSGDLHISKVISDDRTNSLVIVATEKAYLRMLEFIKRIDVPQTGEGEVHVVALQHADAVELVKTLNEVVNAGQGAPAPGQRGGAGNVQANTSIFEGQVRVAADKSTNSILITSSLRDFASIRSVIDRLDQSRRQVFIDAVIMDLNVSRSEKLGFKFHGGSPFSTSNSDDSLLLGGLDAAGTALPTGAADLLQGFALGVRGPAISGTAGSLLGTGVSIPAFGVTMQALTSDTDSDVLSTPHILATDNEDAEIRVGQDTPIQAPVGGIGALGALSGLGNTGTTGASSALGGLGGLTAGLGGIAGQRAKVGTKIKIKPHLNDSDEVRLDLQEEISEVGAATASSSGLGGVPVIERTANTKLVVRDQQTVVIGGLTRNSVRRSATKVPFLGDIPLLGALFRSTQTTREKTNLVLILTPYIIKSQDDLRKVFERKMQERQEFLDRYFVFNSGREYEPPKDWTRTNGLLETMRQATVELAERERMDALTKPKELKTHTPGTPLDMPAVGRAGGGADVEVMPAAEPAAPTRRTRPNLNVDRLER